VSGIRYALPLCIWFCSLLKVRDDNLFRIFMCLFRNKGDIKLVLLRHQPREVSGHVYLYQRYSFSPPFLLVSNICLNCSNSVVFMFFMFELFEQCGIYVFYVWIVRTVWYLCVLCLNCSNSVVFMFFLNIYFNI
jgi:hypothetical protein